MPVRAGKVCRSTGCGQVTTRPDGYCQQCTETGRNDAVTQRREKKTDPFYLSRAWREFSKWFRVCNPLCCECQRPAQLVDHITPISHGGAKLDPANVQSMCTRCHNRKTGRDRSAANQGRSQSLRPLP